MVGDLAVALVAPALVGGYAFACWFWPFTKCGRCKGMGRHMSPSGKNWRGCKRCKGSGRRLRTGRKILNLALDRRDGAK